MAERLLIAAAQLNCTVGDLSGNAGRILQSAERARAAGADLVLTPEFSLCGYPPEDLVLREGFLRDCRRELERLVERAPAVPLVVGFPELAADGRRYNAARPDPRRAHRRRRAQARAAQLRRLRREALLRCRRRAVRIRGEGPAPRARDLRGHLARPRAGGGEGRGRAGHALDQRLAVPQAQAGHAPRDLPRLDPRDRHADGGGEPGRRPGRARLRRGVLRARRLGRARAAGAVLRGVAGAVRVRRRAAGARRGRARAAAGGRDLPGAVPGHARLRGQERLPRRDHRPVGRRRLGADAGRRLRRARRGARARRDDALALHAADEPGRCRRDGAPRRRATTTIIPLQPVYEAFVAALAPQFEGRAPDVDRGEPAGADARHAADGAVEQVRLASC